MLLSTESTLLLGAIELLLGGTIDGGVKERRMTDIDQALGRHFLERLLAQLTLIWTDVAGLDLALETVDQHMETAQMVSVSEPTLSFMMEARLQRHLGHAGAADPVVGDRAGRGPVRRPRGRQVGHAQRGRRHVGPPRRRRRRDDRARRGRLRRDADRGRARAARTATCCGSTPPPPAASRSTPTRCPSTRAGPAAAAAAAPSRSPATWAGRDERRRRPRPARPVHRRGLPRRARDVRRRARSRSARSRRSTTPSPRSTASRSPPWRWPSPTSTA